MRRKLAGILCVLSFFGGLVSPAFAYTYRDFDALLLSVSSPTALAPGEESTITVSWKNTGVAPWNATGADFVSLYGWNATAKAERTSVFQSGSWETSARPWRLSKNVPSGGSVTATFVIRAPQTPGRYQEPFILASENTAWIKLSAFTLDITVASLVSSSQTRGSVEGVDSRFRGNDKIEVGNNTGVVGSQITRSAKLTLQSGKEWQVGFGERVPVELAFTNLGNASWVRDTDEAVWLYAVDGTTPRSSVFKDSGWASASRVVKPVESIIVPNGTATFKFQLTAPKKQGMYHEVFALGNLAGTRWIDGSRVTLDIRVVGQDEFVATAPPDGAEAITPGMTPTVSVPVGPVPQAVLLLKSLSSMTVLGNGRQSITFGWKNTGTKPWGTRALQFVSVTPNKGKNGRVRDDSWGSATEVSRYTEQVKPGEIGFFTFVVKGPARKGSYTATFQLYADNQKVDGGSFDLPITVTADGYLEPETVYTPTPSTSTPTVSTPSADALSIVPLTVAPLGGSTDALPVEPMIRVGITSPMDDRMTVRAKTISVNVTNGGATVCTLDAGVSASVFYDRSRSQYIVSGGVCAGTSATPFVFRAVDGVAPMDVADGSYRAQIELRYAPATNLTWVINELPIEWYLKGIAETSNASPPQFQRTLLTTARTYAMYHVLRGTKHANENYTVDAKYDQVYRGYTTEVKNPNVVVAVDATRGQIVTYNEALAITPYFSRSDGRTRSWGEVWYGQSRYPWLVSVPVPQDAGKTLWGHGVGMSASGALAMANEGKTYDAILKYFYTGVQLRRAYK